MTAAGRAALIAAAVGLVIVAGWVAERRDAARIPPPAERPAKRATAEPRDPEEAPKSTSVPPSTPVQFEASEPTTDPAALQPVVIGVVKPWTEIARMPEYVQANSAQRMAVRDLYWRVCVEAKIPLEHRTSAYWQFVRRWEGMESGAPGPPTRVTSRQLLREQQARVPSPVDAETMERWCTPSP